MEYTGFTQINDQNNFVLIFPQGTVAEGKGEILAGMQVEIVQT